MFIDIHALAYRRPVPFVVQFCTAEQDVGKNLLLFFLMDSYAAKLDDPEIGVERDFIESSQRLSNQTFKHFQGRISRESDNYNSAAKLRWEAYGTGKIQIESHKAALFFATNFIYLIVLASAKLFAQNSLNIISRIKKQILRPISEIFIKFKFHTAFSTGISTYLSRDISAAYAMAAKMSSLFNCGYSLRMSSTDILFAIRSRIRETHILVPYQNNHTYEAVHRRQTLQPEP
jgi:hypothetical protein